MRRIKNPLLIYLLKGGIKPNLLSVRALFEWSRMNDC